MSKKLIEKLFGTGKSQCEFCELNLGKVGKQIQCGYAGKAVDEPEICAAKVLTKTGWIDAALTAESGGDKERGKLYRQQAFNK